MVADFSLTLEMTYSIRTNLNVLSQMRSLLLTEFEGEVMKAYLAVKYHADNRNRHVIERISLALERNHWQTVCVARDLEQWGQIQFAPDELMRRAFAEIDSCDLVVIELTEKGVGLGIEAGYAYAHQIPIVTIARTGADISATLRGVSNRLFAYDDPDDLDGIFSELLDS